MRLRLPAWMPLGVRELRPPPDQRPLVWLSRAALQTMTSDAIRWTPAETGGVILGYEAEGAIVVTSVVLGGPGARRDPHRFSPDAAWQVSQIAQRYVASGRTETYLGDWHTHPRGHLSLSRRDGRTAMRIASSPTARAPRPLMLLLTGDRVGWRGAVWQYEREALVRCRVRRFEAAD